MWFYVVFISMIDQITFKCTDQNLHWYLGTSLLLPSPAPFLFHQDTAASGCRGYHYAGTALFLQTRNKFLRGEVFIL